AILLRALAPGPEDRYQEAIEIKREVEAVLAGEPAVSATTRATWPCIRFSIPRVSWTGASVQGELFRDETTLVLEFCIVGMFRVYEPRRVQIPLDEILTISCHTSGWWKLEIFLKAHHLAALAELPAGRQGKGRLQINWDDREAAQQLVDSIVHRPLPQPAGQLPGRAGPVKSSTLIASGGNSWHRPWACC